MLTSVVQAMLLRELAAVQRSVEAYPDDVSVWVLPRGLPNSGGTLVLHLAGNLQHYLGAVLGGTGYRRDRPAEFARRDLPRAALVAEAAAAIEVVKSVLPTLSDQALSAPYPEPIGGRVLTTGVFLVHLATHLAHHLGQVEVGASRSPLRRMVNQPTSPRAALPSAPHSAHASSAPRTPAGTRRG